MCFGTGETTRNGELVSHILLDNLAVTKQDLFMPRYVNRAVLIGNPNVGKSVLFNALTGRSVMVSNYPGTTVTISRGRCTIGEDQIELIDTPGMYSFYSITEEERVARSVLFTETPSVVLNVADARNLKRMLPLTLQLIEANLPLIFVLNMMDEAEAAGVDIDMQILREELGIPIVPTVATQRSNIEGLRKSIADYLAPDFEEYEEKNATRVESNAIS